MYDENTHYYITYSDLIVSRATSKKGGVLDLSMYLGMYGTALKTPL